MTGRSWAETRKVTITKDLQRNIDGGEVLLGNLRAERADKIAAVAKVASQLTDKLLGERLIADAAEIHGAAIAQYEGIVGGHKRALAKRKSDKRFEIEVRHIGTLADPVKEKVMRAKHTEDFNLVLDAAREQLVKKGRPLQDKDAGGKLINFVELSARQDPEWILKLSAHVKEWIVEGVVGGEKRYKELWNLGGAQLLHEAAEEVKSWQGVSFDEGED